MSATLTKTRRMLAMNVLAGAPRCQREELVPITTRGGYPIIRRCDHILEPVPDAVSPEGIDPWMMLFRCPVCNTEVWINRGILPLGSGGLR